VIERYGVIPANRGEAVTEAIRAAGETYHHSVFMPTDSTPNRFQGADRLRPLRLNLPGTVKGGDCSVTALGQADLN